MDGGSKGWTMGHSMDSPYITWRNAISLEQTSSACSGFKNLLTSVLVAEYWVLPSAKKLDVVKHCSDKQTVQALDCLSPPESSCSHSWGLREVKQQNKEAQ